MYDQMYELVEQHCLEVVRPILELVPDATRDTQVQTAGAAQGKYPLNLGQLAILVGGISTSDTMHCTHLALAGIPK